MSDTLRPSLRPGDTLGPYKIESLSGQGGMGQVYCATDTRLGRSVAIKVSAKEFSDRFEREARAISALNHPNICTLYDVGPNYLVMEFVEGDTLSTILAQGPLPLDRALQYAVQIADALSAAHAKGIIHRDLKPGNIIVTRNGVKVLDFGLAKLSAVTLAGEGDSSKNATLTAPITSKGAVLGTLHYMSPEQVEGKEATDRSDIFSFGAVLYEMITGTRPFAGDSPAGIMAAILKDPPPSIRQRQPLTPRALERVVAKCLEKNPLDRWHSAHDLKPTLELIDLDATPSSAGSSSVSSANMGSASGSQVALAAPARRPWLVPAVALLAIAVVAAVAWAYWPSSAPTGRVTRFEVALPKGAEINANTFYVQASPDGNKIAILTSGDKGGIWVRDLEAVEARLLPGTANAVSPFWSPDSKNIAFGVGTKLMRVSVSGGPPQVLCESATAVGSGFWTEEGEIVFGGRGTGPIQKVAQAGGIPTPVTKLQPGEGFNGLPTLLPDGRHFIYLRPFQGQNSLFVGSLDVKPEEQPLKPFAPVRFGATFVRSGRSDSGNLFFLRDRTLMAQAFDTKKMELTGDPVPVAQQVGNGQSHGHFSVTPSGLLAYRTGRGEGTRMTWLDRTGKDMSAVGEAGTSGRALRLSPDESQVALFRNDGTVQNTLGDIWVLDTARNVESRLTFGQSAANVNPVWSPDGKYIVYPSPHGEKVALMIKPSSGAGDARVLQDALPLAPRDWSRDGRFLLAEHRGGGMVVLPMKGAATDGEVAELLAGDAAQAKLSPDGHWIAYTSRESGRPEVYIQPFRPPGQSSGGAGAKWQVSRNGGQQPRWRGDGAELFFVGTEQGLMAAQIEVTGDALRPAAPVELFKWPLRGTGQWDAARDGQRFLAALPLDRGNDTAITVIMNWQAALKK